ncbi:UNKNOWN [Stylonychia lemnae]|uniref:Uncharacterized protein n=1 Tax=Stylonychia lemnae TaxID=5949 RepID=A0A078B2N4_STYLE|nr:UNKNOWN [Stylonychia lemnae]|eukprot:CDW87748.1 UNKNOWN [Stylonychia lemnae]
MKFENIIVRRNQDYQHQVLFSKQTFQKQWIILQILKIPKRKCSDETSPRSHIDESDEDYIMRKPLSSFIDEFQEIEMDKMSVRLQLPVEKNEYKLNVNKDNYSQASNSFRGNHNKSVNEKYIFHLLQIAIKEKLIKKLINLLARQETEVEQQYQRRIREQKKKDDEERFKKMLFYQPSGQAGSNDPEKQALMEQLKKLEEENAKIKEQIEVFQDNNDNLQHMSEDCISVAERFREEAEQCRLDIKYMRDELDIQKQLEEERIQNQEQRHREELQAISNKIAQMRVDFDKEILIKDALIKKIEAKKDEYKTQLKQAIAIMRIPRLMNQAEKMLNFDRIEITQLSPKKSPERQNEKIDKTSEVSKYTKLIQSRASRNQSGWKPKIQTSNNFLLSPKAKSLKSRRTYSRNNNNTAFSNVQIQQLLTNYLTQNSSFDVLSPEINRFNNGTLQSFNYQQADKFNQVRPQSTYFNRTTLATDKKDILQSINANKMSFQPSRSTLLSKHKGQVSRAQSRYRNQIVNGNQNMLLQDSPYESINDLSAHLLSDSHMITQPVGLSQTTILQRRSKLKNESLRINKDSNISSSQFDPSVQKLY